MNKTGDAKVKETGIMMSGDHPRKILDGLKTQTRRTYGLEKINQEPDVWDLVPELPTEFFLFRNKNGTELLIKCPYGQAGDRLWVRETFCQVCYKNDNEKDICYKEDLERFHYGSVGCAKYKPTYSIFMHRWASRITLEITGVRAERLQEITVGDCLKEGAPRVYANIEYLDWYEELWDPLNAKRGYSWESNPWVWVISFKEMPK